MIEACSCSSKRDGWTHDPGTNEYVCATCRRPSQATILRREGKTAGGFVHLRVTSGYAPMQGAVRVKDLVEWARENDVQHVCFSDPKTMHGAYALQKAALDAGLTPIFAIRSERVLYVALSDEGLANLIAMSSGASGSEFEHLKSGKGLLVVVPDICTDEHLATYRKLYGAVAVELQVGNEDQWPALAEWAASNKLRILPSADVRFGKFEQRVDYLLLEAIRTKRLLDDVADTPGEHLLSVSEMTERFEEFPEAFEGMTWLLGREFPLLAHRSDLWPEFPVPEGKTVDEHLWDEIMAGVARRYPNLVDGEAAEEIGDRLSYEYEIITGKGYSGYFLVVADLIGWAKRTGIRVGPGRGSAAGALISFLLGITDTDPLRHGLLFERFLNPERESPPDIDIDFEVARRGEVIEYLVQRWGADQVAQIATLGTFKAKQAIKDATRVLAMPYGLGERLSAVVPPAIVGRDCPLYACFDESHERYADAKAMRELVDSEPEAQMIVEHALRLEGLVRQTGVHAAGVVVSSKPLAATVPMMTIDGQFLTQLDYPSCEALGLLKFDVLGLRNLDVMSKAIDLIERETGTRLDPLEIPLDDPETLKLLRAGDTLGVFQLDSGPIRGLLRSMQPDRFDDVAAVLALYRPGPMAAGFHHAYAKRKNGAEEIEPIHPALEEALEPVLGPTYDVLIYQEQTLEIARVLAGYSLGQADELRRAMGKKKREVMAAEYERFHAGMLANGYDEEAVQAIWSAVEANADYQFNKCTSGDTIVDSLGYRRSTKATATGYRGTIQQMYERLHGRDDAGPGECHYCRDDNSDRMKSDTMCSPCASWRSKVGMKGIWVPGVIGGRVAPVRVKDIFKTGLKRVFRVTLVDGRYIDATANHRHLTPSGWRTVEALKPGDSLLTHEKRAPGAGLKSRGVTKGRGWAASPAAGRAVAADGRSRPTLGGHSSAARTFRRENAGSPCLHCRREWTASHEVAHLDQDATNGDPANLAILCNSCHKKYDYAAGARNKRWTQGREIREIEIASIEDRGITETFDLEVDSEHHSWSANGGIITHNSHSVSYGLVSWWTAYLKANYPAAYMAAVLSTTSEKKDRTAMYLQECRRMGIEVLPPHVLDSDLDYVVEGEAIRVGLGSIDGLGADTAGAIVSRRGGDRPQTLLAWARTAPPAVIAKRPLEALIRAGALQGFGHTRKSLLKGVAGFMPALKGASLAAEHELPLFPAEVEVEIPDLGEFSREELLGYEKAAFGLYVSAHPLAILAQDIASLAENSIAELAALDDKERVRIAGMVTSLLKKTTREGGKPWAIVTVEDLDGDVEVLIFPNSWKAMTGSLREGAVLVVEGRVSKRDGALAVIPDTISVLGTKPNPPVVLRLPARLVDIDTVEDILLIAQRHPGESSLEVAVVERGKWKLVEFGRVRSCPELVLDLKTRFGPRAVRVG